eukprot:sb/3465978/
MKQTATTTASRSNAAAGTKKQIDYGIELVLKIVSKKNDGSALEVISYETDILENYIQDEESLVCLGEFTESYPKVLIKVEPHKKRIVVKGDVSDDVKKITEYLRESLSDYAAEYVGKSKARSPPTRNVDGVVTKPFSLGLKHPDWISLNKATLLQISVKHHVTLHFPTKREVGLTIAGKASNVAAADSAMVAALHADMKESKFWKPVEPAVATIPSPSEANISDPNKGKKTSDSTKAPTGTSTKVPSPASSKAPTSGASSPDVQIVDSRAEDRITDYRIRPSIEKFQDMTLNQELLENLLFWEDSCEPTKLQQAVLPNILSRELYHLFLLFNNGCGNVFETPICSPPTPTHNAADLFRPLEK